MKQGLQATVIGVIVGVAGAFAANRMIASVLFGVQKSVQFRYASTAGDGKPVYYEVHLTPDDKPPQVLSFALQFPAADAQSAQRANRLAAAIDR